VFDKVLAAGFIQLMNDVRPINAPANHAGLNVRTPTSRVMINFVQTLGGSQAPIALAEVYTSLQTHVDDGIMMTLDGFEGYHRYETQKCTTWCRQNFGNDAWNLLEKATDALELVIFLRRPTANRATILA